MSELHLPEIYPHCKQLNNNYVKGKNMEDTSKTIESNEYLTTADKEALARNDHDYINAKGAKLYGEQSYAQAVEYYHLAAAMGNVNSISNLGYCYLYGRDIPQDISMAISYFKISTAKGNPDAAYKLGDIYSRDKWGLEDKELSIYYYRLAVKFITGQSLEALDDFYFYLDELADYPSLCFALARELGTGGSLIKNIPLSYQFLQYAKLGYEKELGREFEMYRESYESVLELMQKPEYDEAREEFERKFSGDEVFDYLNPQE